MATETTNDLIECLYTSQADVMNLLRLEHQPQGTFAMAVIGPFGEGQLYPARVEGDLATMVRAAQEHQPAVVIANNRDSFGEFSAEEIAALEAALAAQGVTIPVYIEPMPD